MSFNIFSLLLGATTPEFINKSRDQVMRDKRFKVLEITSIMAILSKWVYNIMYRDPKTKKLSVKWVQRLLTVGQRRDRPTCSNERMCTVLHALE